MKDRERQALENANIEVYKAIASVVDKIAFNIGLEDYENAKQQINLLKELIDTVAGSKR